jgi:hypothetical protein
MSANHQLSAFRLAAGPALCDWDPDHPASASLLGEHLLRQGLIPCVAFALSAAITAQLKPGSPIAVGSTSAAYQAAIDDVLRSNRPTHMVSVWHATLAAAQLPQSISPAGFARGLTTIAQAAGLAIPSDLLAAAPPRLSAMLRVRMTAFELQAVRRAAAVHDPSGDVSLYVRAALDAFALPGGQRS